jgi:dTDP-4-dehydrorhamnose reductase
VCAGIVRSAPRIVVTGANGQVGWELVHRLESLGEVISVTREVLDFMRPVRVENALTSLRPSIIVNAAAYTAVDKAESDEASAFKINSDSVAAIGRAARTVGASVVHFSTDYVFDGETNEAYVETDETKPLNVYGRSKRAGERVLAETGADHLTIRTSWVYATRGNNFVLTILRLAHERDTLEIVDDQIGTPTWAGWLADATATILAQQLGKVADGSNARLFADVPNLVHLTGGGEASWYDFAKAIVALDPALETQRLKTINAIPTSRYPTAARRPKRSVLDSSLAVRTFGIDRVPWRAQLELATAELAK